VVITSDSINQPIRVNAAYSESGTSVYSLRLEPADARSLGLREGQVVNAMLALRADGNVLLLGRDKRIQLPQSVRLPVGAVSVSVTQRASGDFFLAVRQMLPSASAYVSSSSVDRIHSLLGRPLTFEYLKRALSPLGALSAERLNRLGASVINQNQLQPGSLSAQAVRQTLLNSGLLNEAVPHRHEGRRPINLKAILIEVLRANISRGADVSQLSQGLDEIESFQLDMLGNQLIRNTSFSWLIPVVGEWPIIAHIERDKGDGGQNSDNESDNSSWKVDLRITLAQESHLDLSLRITDSQKLHLMFWIADIQLYQIAVNHRHWLAEQLKLAGLTMSELRIFPSGRPVTETEQIYSPAARNATNGIVLDV